MDTLKSLIAKHKFYRNQIRFNADGGPTWVDRRGQKWLRRGPCSNTLQQGEVLEHVQTIYPWANRVCLNRKRASSPPMVPHRDKGNCSQSAICLWGDYETGGELCLEDGTVFSEKETWHAFDGANTTHWVNPHDKGFRYSVVAFARPAKKRKRQERPHELD